MCRLNYIDPVTRNNRHIKRKNKKAKTVASYAIVPPASLAGTPQSTPPVNAALPTDSIDDFGILLDDIPTTSSKKLPKGKKVVASVTVCTL
jgi:hypothetical protein